MPEVIVLADGAVGLRIVAWLAECHREDIRLVVTTSQNEIHAAARAADLAVHVFTTEKDLISRVRTCTISPDLGFLVWWPKIVKPPLLSLPRLGFINTHPSLLPHNRGKHYNFWAIVEEAPFGVTLHCVDEGTDTGPIVAQLPIAFSWEDTGETLYAKAQEGMVALFQKEYGRLRRLDFTVQPQDSRGSSFHLARELESATRIDLDRTYTARGLLNLLRARTFKGHPGCRFIEDGRAFEIRIEIKEMKP